MLRLHPEPSKPAAPAPESPRQSDPQSNAPEPSKEYAGSAYDHYRQMARQADLALHISKLQHPK